VLDAHSLKPGQKTELRVTFATANAPGPFEKIITLEMDVPGQEKIELYMTGSVKAAPAPKITGVPRRINLGNVKVGEVKKYKIAVTNPGDLPLKVSAVKIKAGATVTVAAESLPVTVAAGKNMDLEFSVTAVKQGEIDERIMIESDASNVSKTGFAIFVKGKAE
jgi:hypothetical protein